MSNTNQIIFEGVELDAYMVWGLMCAHPNLERDLRRAKVFMIDRLAEQRRARETADGEMIVIKDGDTVAAWHKQAMEERILKDTEAIERAMSNPVIAGVTRHCSFDTGDEFDLDEFKRRVRKYAPEMREVMKEMFGEC